MTTPDLATLRDLEARLKTVARAPMRNYAGVPDVGSLPSLGLDEEMPAGPTAPDGVPWRKCCAECQYRDRSTIRHLETDCAEANAAFYCLHRQDDGHYRVCAGFAARDRREPGARAEAAVDAGVIP